MEFVKRNLKWTNIRTTLISLLLLICLLFLIYQGIDYLNNVRGFHISNQLTALIIFLVFLVETIILIFGIIQLDIKVIIEDNQLKYYIRKLSGYKLAHQISIDDISYIRERFIVAKFRGMAETATLYYVIDKNDKQRFELQYLQSRKEVLTNNEGVTIIDYLRTHYNINAKENFSRDVRDTLVGIGISLGIVIGFIILMIIIARWLF